MINRTTLRILFTILVFTGSLATVSVCPAQDCLDYEQYTRQIGGMPTNAATLGVAIRGDFAYLPSVDQVLYVLDISDPAVPVIVGTAPIAGPVPWTIQIAGNHAYVANHTEGLQVYDISDPTAPFVAGSLAPVNITLDVLVEGDYAYIADREAGLHVVDITDPTNPVITGSYNTPGNAWGVAVAGDLAYVTTIDDDNPIDTTVIGQRDLDELELGPVGPLPLELRIEGEGSMFPQAPGEGFKV